MTYHLGIDLGTTWTAAALVRDGRAQSVSLDNRSTAVPSVVYLDGQNLLVGRAAERHALTEPSRVAREFKRRVGDPTPLLLGGSPVTAELLMARLLAWVVHQVSTTEGGPPASLAVTHPANWGEYKLDLLRQAIRHVDVRVDHLLPEPVAAASFYASERELPPGSTVAVYDLGGGTFDAALVRAEESGFRIVGQPDGIERLGGIDFDHAVFGHVAAAVDLDVDSLDVDDPTTAAAMAQLRQDCVEAKEALSTDADVSIPVLLPTRHTQVRLTRSEFEAMIRPALDETLVALRRAAASAQVPVDELHAVLLVGGSSRIPLIAQLVMAELRRPVAVDARPKEAISQGAALVAARSPSPVGQQVVPSPAPFPVKQAIVATDPARRAAPVAPGDLASDGMPPAPGATTPQWSPVWLVVALVFLVVGLAGVVAVLAWRGDDDSGQETGNGGSSDTGTTDNGDSGSSTTSTTESGDNPLGDLGDLGGLGTSGAPPPDPLPGDDWSDEARSQFVTDCVASLESAAAVVSVDPDDVCGCTYDNVAASGVSFGDFNTEWSAEEVDPQSEGGQALTSAINSCILGGG